MTELWTHEGGPEFADLVVLVHGSMDRSASMVKVGRLLDMATHDGVEALRVARYDRRGYGRSKPHPGPFTIDDQVADLVGVLAGRRAVVFGHSYGGNVALATAARHPELVRAVAVYETPLSWLPWWKGSTRRWSRDRPPAEVAEAFMRRVVGDAVWERLPAAVQSERRAEGATLQHEIADIAERAPWVPDDIDVPVVVMAGGDTTGHHVEGCEYLASTLSDRPVIAVPGARHNGPYTHPQPVAAVIRELTTNG